MLLLKNIHNKSLLENFISKIVYIIIFNINIMIPNLVFIVPYRDRKPQKKVFECVMSDILKGENYKIFFIHQNDKRPFNRGAIKNLGFLYIKNIYQKIIKILQLYFMILIFYHIIKTSLIIIQITQ